MTLSRRVFGLCAGAAVVAACMPGAALAAVTKSTAYYGVGDGSSNAYLIDWLPKSKARVANIIGAQNGTVANDGTQKVVTLNSPISSTVASFDDCGEKIQQRTDTNQVVVRDLTGGVTQFVEIGTVTNIGGCQDGQSVPFGSLTDEGQSLRRLAMTARPPMSDLVPGVEIAGFSDDVMLPGEFAVAQDRVTMQAESMRFWSSGASVPFAVSPDAWLLLQLPSGQRAYTRLAVDAKTQGETWLMADWVGGRAARVEEVTMVKPTDGAGFGTVAQASRIWESGLFIATRTPFEIDLYKNGTGERVLKDLDLGTERRTPITSWELSGPDLQQHRSLGEGTGDRTWVPLSNVGKVHWVMEDEKYKDPNGASVLIKPRVNYYKDIAKAVPPTAASKASSGFVSMHDKPTVAR